MMMMRGFEVNVGRGGGGGGKTRERSEFVLEKATYLLHFTFCLSVR
jgi:hypothetical protein